MCTEERPCEDTARRWPSASQEERPHQKPTLTVPWSWTMRKQISVVYTTQPMVFFLWQPKQTNIVRKLKLHLPDLSEVMAVAEAAGFCFCFCFCLMWTIFQVFFEFVTILLLFYVLVFWPQGMWDLSSPTGDQTCTPCIGRGSLNHRTAREVPKQQFWEAFLKAQPPICFFSPPKDSKSHLMVIANLLLLMSNQGDSVLCNGN